MTAVKTLAFGVLVIGAAVQSAKAGPYSGTFNWTSWNAGSGAFQSSGTSNSIDLTPINYPITPTVTPAPAPVYVPAPAAPAPIAVTNSTPVVPAPAPVIVPDPIVVNTPTPIAAMASVPAAPVPSTTSLPVMYDAFINLGSKSFPDAAGLTASAPQAWYNSTQITGLFGGQPNAQQQSDFSSAVVQRVEQTFQLAGIHLNLTTDPNAQAAHTLSVVGNTTSSWGPLLGLTNIGGNGFDFIDQAAKSATSVDQLEWIVAHNVSHELMLAFGVGENYDKTGSYIDAEMANLGMMLNPNATFSSAAAAALIATGSLNDPTGTTGGAFAQQLSPQPVPEPTTIALWAAAAISVVIVRRRHLRRLTA